MHSSFPCAPKLCPRLFVEIRALGTVGFLILSTKPGNPDLCSAPLWHTKDHQEQQQVGWTWYLLSHMTRACLLFPLHRMCMYTGVSIWGSCMLIQMCMCDLCITWFFFSVCLTYKHMCLHKCMWFYIQALCIQGHLLLLWVSVCAYASLFIHIHVHTCVLTAVHVQSTCLCEHKHAPLFIYTWYACIHTVVRARVHAHGSESMHPYSYTHMCT